MATGRCGLKLFYRHRNSRAAVTATETNSGIDVVFLHLANRRREKSWLCPGNSESLTSCHRKARRRGRDAELLPNHADVNAGCSHKLGGMDGCPTYLGLVRNMLQS